MTVPVAGNATSSSNGNVTNCVANTPSGVVAGDTLIAQILMAAGGSTLPSAVTITPPAGWSLILRNDNGTSMTSALYYRVATGTEAASYTWTLSGAAINTGQMFDVHGGHSSLPINIYGGQSNSSSVNVVAPSVTTTVSNTLIMFFGAVLAAATFTPPSGMTEIQDVNSSESAYVAQAAAGATGTKTATASSAGVNIGQLVAVAPTNAPPARKAYYPAMTGIITR